jgi:hypothetical protein
MTIGSMISGKILDLEYRRVSKLYRMRRKERSQVQGVEEMDVKAAREDPDFPIEYVSTTYYCTSIAESQVTPS